MSECKMQLDAFTVLPVLTGIPQPLHGLYNNDIRYSKYNTATLVIRIGLNWTLTDGYLPNLEIDSNIIDIKANQ